MIVSIVKRKKVRSRSRIEGKRPASNAANKYGIANRFATAASAALIMSAHRLIRA